MRKSSVVALVAAALAMPSFAQATDYLRNVDSLMKEPSGGARKGDIRIATKDKKHFIYMPRDITRAKDCHEFRDFVNQISTIAGFMDANNTACPWEKQLTGPVGEFTVNGVKFRIPREYLWQGQNDPDGPAKDDALYLMMKWPNLEPASAGGDQSANIRVTINKGGSGTCPDGKTVKRSYVSYLASAEMIDFHQADKSRSGACGALSAEPVLLFENYRGWKYYKLPRAMTSNALHKDFFVKGDPMSPDEWLRCEMTRCYTKIDINGKVLIDVGYNQYPFLQISDTLHPRLIEKVKSFIQP